MASPRAIYAIIISSASFLGATWILFEKYDGIGHIEQYNYQFAGIDKIYISLRPNEEVRGVHIQPNGCLSYNTSKFYKADDLLVLYKKGKENSDYMEVSSAKHLWTGEDQNYYAAFVNRGSKIMHFEVLRLYLDPKKLGTYVGACGNKGG